MLNRSILHMNEIQVLDRKFVPFLPAEDIQVRIKEMAAEISRDMHGKNPLFLAILNGSFMFAADLFKYLTIPAEICFIKLASYKGTKSTGHVITAIGLDIPVKDREIIILEDIVDTGRTLNAFMPELLNQQPAQIQICALLHKVEATVFPLEVKYVGFEIPDRFVVGYGLDYDGYGRNLDAIYQVS